MEGNKTIAFFMGAKVKGGLLLGYNLYFKDHRVLKWATRTEKIMWEELSKHNFYHDSWSWLMPVLARVNDRWVELDWEGEPPEELKELYDALIHIDIKGVYIQTVKFIGWYNEQIKIKN